MTITHDDLTVNGTGVDGCDPSAALLEANRRLHELRAKQAQHSADKEPAVSVAPRPKRDGVHRRAEIVILPPPDLQAERCPSPIYSHDSSFERRESADLEAANRRLHTQQMACMDAQKSPIRKRKTTLFNPLRQTLVNINADVSEDGETVDLGSDTVLLHPSVAVALLKQNRVAVGRLWLLARSLDTCGKGCVDVEVLRERLTDKQNGLYVCGWRRLRMLLGQGDGLFWERGDDGRLWLYQPGRVAVLLGVEHVEGVSVFINVKQLLDIQSCRAHFYASWFSGRKTTNPISRAVLTRLTGVSEEMQRLYEKIAKVDVTPCIAVGEAYDRERMMEAGYSRGFEQGHGEGVVFEFIDHKGKRGKAGQSYIAWHLPNRYAGTHRQAGKSSRRKINRYLKRQNNLEKKLTLGNVDDVEEEKTAEIPVRVFFNGVKAATAVRKSRLKKGDEVYWDGIKTKRTASDIYDVMPMAVLRGDGCA